MGAQWKHGFKAEAAAKRGLAFGKLSKEITVAAKSGDPSPENNARLRAAIEAARKSSVPKDTIERAIKKGAGIGDDSVNYETIMYEGFAPHNVPVIVECLTDNKNRTASEMRVFFRKGQLGSIGSVGWMFDRVGLIEAVHSKALEREDAAIEAGAQDVEALDESEVDEGQTGGRFYTEPTDLDVVNKALADLGWSISKSELAYRAKSDMDLTDEQYKEVANFLGAIDDFDDVHRVYAGLK
jgi:YebC/PmpR family DNA-binding regulatory protein